MGARNQRTNSPRVPAPPRLLAPRRMRGHPWSPRSANISTSLSRHPIWAAPANGASLRRVVRRATRTLLLAGLRLLWFYLAAMTLKSMQDKSNGAMIAGMGTPWGADAHDSNPAGYHLVWSRDLFKFANALITAGDLQTGSRVVEYLFDTLMQSSDCGTNEGNPRPGAACPQGYSRNGRFPQNAWVSGFPHWPGTQLDEQGMPILLAWRVYDRGNAATKAQINALWPKMRATADFVVNTGPWTHQERWEENSGYSPSTIAAAIAGLVAASRFALSNGDATSAARYLAAADYWQRHADSQPDVLTIAAPASARTGRRVPRESCSSPHARARRGSL
jgi:GH15 family glucan-1,4-alpha-glucosidase